MTALLKRKILKFFVYFITVYVLYILQSTAEDFKVAGIMPMLVLPACLCLSVFEGPVSAGIFGFFAGLLCDCAAETVFGFNALFFMVLCVSTELVFTFVLRRSVLNVMLIGLLTIFIRAVLEFFFAFVLYGYSGLAQFFYTVIAPQAAITAVYTIPFYYVFRKLHERFEPEETRE